MIDTWERAWAEFTPFLEFPVELRTDRLHDQRHREPQRPVPQSRPPPRPLPQRAIGAQGALPRRHRKEAEPSQPDRPDQRLEADPERTDHPLRRPHPGRQLTMTVTPGYTRSDSPSALRFSNASTSPTTQRANAPEPCVSLTHAPGPDRRTLLPSPLRHRLHQQEPSRACRRTPRHRLLHQPDDLRPAPTQTPRPHPTHRAHQHLHPHPRRDPRRRLLQQIHDRVLRPLIAAPDRPPAPTDLRHAMATIDHVINQIITNACLGTAA